MGKTTALRCGLTLVRAYPDRFHSRASIEKYTALSCNCNLPFGIDDPKSIAALSELTQGSTFKRGDEPPTSMAVILSRSAYSYLSLTGL